MQRRGEEEEEKRRKEDGRKLRNLTTPHRVVGNHRKYKKLISLKLPKHNSSFAPGFTNKELKD